MANDQGMGLGLFPINAPYGIVKIGYYRADTAKALYRFQPVQVDGVGKVIPAKIGDLEPIMGSVVGFLDAPGAVTGNTGNQGKAGLPSGLTSLSQGAYLPAGKEAWVAISDDPDQEYMIEADTGGGTYPDYASSFGKTANFVYEATTGSTTTGICNARLDISDIAADTGGQLFILRPADNINTDGTVNAMSAPYTKWIVKITKPQAGQLALTFVT